MLKDALRQVRSGLKASGWGIGTRCGLIEKSSAPVSFLVEKADWSIRWDGEHIRDVVNGLTGQTTVDTTDVIPRAFGAQVVHFGSQYMWLDWGRFLPKRAHVAVSFFHGKPEDGPEVARHIDSFMESVPMLTKVITAASLIEQRLLAWGVPREKLVRIPIGVDTQSFRLPSPAERAQARARFGFRNDQIVIGSFQKDGVGWGDGMEPKLIKGPDLLVEAVGKMARDLPVAVLLTGPARGYVKAELTRRQIPFVHTFIKNQADIADCYHPLDMYLVTSREEGGPKGIMESMASGVPVVSTAVGMAEDLILDGVTGGLVRGEMAGEIADKAMHLLHSIDLAGLCERARQAVLVTDWNVVGGEHWSKVYQPALLS
jgi:glycosyltransferase involved in cell wall biosynthesis